MDDYRKTAPEILRKFLSYHETIRGHSKKTVDEYFLDLRTFFRFLKKSRAMAPDNADLSEISISDVDLPFVASVTLEEVYDYLAYLSRERPVNAQNPYSEKGLSATSRARKISSIKSFYKYLTVSTKELSENPLVGLESPKIPKTLPAYLSLEESKKLLSAVDGQNTERDYCILCIFLNCGLRISEIVGLNISDIRADHIRVLGKGNKERVVFLNDSTAEAINNYLNIRKTIKTQEKSALFLSTHKKRMSRDAVHYMVKKTLLKAGIDRSNISSHKLRHTAATLMLQNGVDVRTLQELLGHEHLNTTQIYTHVDNDGLRTAAQANPLGSFSPKTKPE